MEIIKARPNHLSTQQDRLRQSSERTEKRNDVVSLLAKLGIRRQAKQAAEDYLVMADDLLSYDLADIAAGLDVIGKRVREQGETAFPDVPTMLEAVGAIVSARMSKEADLRRKREDEESERHRREHPEDYFHISELLQGKNLRGIK